jgi:probable phosphoglycerate mutase
MPTILLIRHAENDYIKKGRLPGRLQGVHLNEKGRAQAQALAEKLAQAPIKAVYTSPLERAVETAEPIAQVLGMEAVVRPGLIETNCGDWQGKSYKSLRRLKIWRKVQITPSLFRFPGGESFVEAQTRIVGDLEALQALHDEKDLFVCVSHGDPIKLAIAYYLGMPLDHFQRLFTAPASISTLYVGEGGSHLLTLNFDLSFNLSKP